ncbi:hypothetical protein PRIPAC_95604 [Pristionchus pacificus]|uniref:Uncharacterized protein n=1 Tax=Pristionchus pacificus TaxID=54126 RepID=A0A2A6B2U8_PRIPA|nr:hypothetical protein PRIPAC_95604 [Pristionchus pacificus]|eukprot:PDM60206.1 hypothetical protein PRIPAC_54031 [Pristionchus pacificus]
MISSHDTVHLGVVWMLNTLAVFFNIYLIMAIILRSRLGLASEGQSIALVPEGSQNRTVKRDHIGEVRAGHCGTPKTLRSYAVLLFCNAILDVSSAIVCAMGCVSLALHTILVQVSLVILLLSFAYRLYLLGGDMLKSTRSSITLEDWITMCYFFSTIRIPYRECYFALAVYY